MTNAQSRLLLHIDDSPEDRFACRRALAAHAPNWDILEAETGEAGLALLETTQPNCVLLDYHLPDMDGLEVLATLGERVRETPVILATGQGDEAVAVKALKAGARDYLTKDARGLWLQLLPGVLERTVSDHRRELRELREREARMRLLLESSGDGIYGVDSNGRCTFANRACLTMLGYTDAEELHGRDIHALVHHHHPDGRDYPATDCPIAAAWRRGEGVQAEDETYWRRDGSGFPVDYSAFPMRDAGGTLLGAVVSFRDISERKKNEERLRRLTRTYAMLSGCNQDLVHSTSEAELVDRFCHTLVQTGEFSLAWITLRDVDSQETLRTLAHAGRDVDFERRLCTTPTPETGQLGLAMRALREDRVITAQIPEETLCFQKCPLSHPTCAHQAVAALPLRQEGVGFGVLALYSAEADAFDDQALALLKELAEDLAFGLTKLRDRIARVQAEAALYLHDQAIQAASNGIIIVNVGDPDLPLIYANPAFERITGYSSAEVLGNPCSFLAGEDQEQPGLEAIRSAIKRQEPISVLLRSYRKNGELFWSELHVAPVQDKASRVSHCVAILNEVSDRVRYEQELEYQAAYDALTGLPNRHLLEDRLAQALAYAERYRRTCAVLFLDLDRFKLVNDNLGHHVGDELLKVMALRLATGGREGDTLARYGGDEFVVVLPDLTHPDDLDRVAERLRMAVAEPVRLLGEELRLTTSMGVAQYPQDGRTPEALMRCADIAMYRAKGAGGNRLCRFSSDMGEQLSERMHLERELRRALEQGDLTLHYQPQVALENGHLIGMEALARWTHPERGMISPVRFIPLAEETGLILQLGEQMLELACNQAMAWRRQGLTVPTVAVNLSARQLALSGLEQTVAEILERTGMPGNGLELEVTESALMHSPEQVLERLQRLKRLGITLSLDDFGTGYSSLSYLKHFPFDLMKIDQSFVRDLTQDPNDAAITVTIIQMARSLGLKVVAEGVEGEAQHAFLLAHGCNYGQGWLYGRPMPAEAMGALMASAGDAPLRAS